MKILVVYYSHTANNKKLANELQRLLGCNILKIEELKRRTGFTILWDVVFNRIPSVNINICSLKEYDHIIFIAPIWAGKIATPLKAFLLNEKPNIHEYSFITLCGGSKGQNEKIRKELSILVNKEPFKVSELRINDLLTPERKDTIKYTSGHRITDEELKIFEKQIYRFLEGFVEHEALG